LDALRAIGVELSAPSFENKNAVFLEDFETTIQLEALAIHLGIENMEFEPEQFPGSTGWEWFSPCRYIDEEDDVTGSIRFLKY
jgi:hypothetical protein